MSSQLSALPVDKRRQFAATLGLFSVLFVAVGTVAATGADTTILRIFVIVALVVAVLLALMAWGVVHSLRVDSARRAESVLDAAIEQAVAAAPQRFGQLCTCGHEHDPTELHITDAEQPPAASVQAGCPHDSAGAACAHDCASCVLTALRPSPTTSRAERLSR